MSIDTIERPATAFMLDERAVWTADDVAVYLRVSRRKVDLLRKLADFPKSMSLGGGYPRFRAGKIMEWIAAQEEAAEAA